MKKLLLTAFFLFILSQQFSFAQITFQRLYYLDFFSSGQSVKQTPDGGYIITGEHFGNSTFPYIRTIYLLKTNAYGDVMWTNAIGRQGAGQGYEVGLTNEGGYILAGYNQIIKTNGNGNVSWSKNYGIYPQFVEQTSDGGYIITGGNDDLAIVKVDNAGNILWAYSYGGATNEGGYCVRQTSDGGYVVIGISNSFSAGDYSIYIVRTDNAGNLTWSKTYYVPDWQGGYEIQQTTDGGFIFCGDTWNGSDSADILLAKTDTSGNIEWSKVYGGTSSEVGFSVQQTSDGGFILAGTSGQYLVNSGACVIKINSIGDTLWTRQYGFADGDAAYSIQQTTDGGYIISGINGGSEDSLAQLYLIKTDEMGHSNCLENSLTISVSNFPMSESTPPTVVNTLTSVVNEPYFEFNGGQDSILCLMIGIETLQKQKFDCSLSPNPFHSTTTLQLPYSFSKGTLKIYNTLGSLVKEQSLTGQSAVITREGLRDGIYFVVVSEGENEWRGKVVVE
jgi:hypothetical protein